MIFLYFKLNSAYKIIIKDGSNILNVTNFKNNLVMETVFIH